MSYNRKQAKNTHRYRAFQTSWSRTVEDGLTALRELYLGGNLLSELPILSAPNLVVMEVAWNRLRELSVQTFPRLQWLDASSNQLRSTEGLDKLEDLQLLILQNNSLTELPDMMANCSLVSLLVGFNLLTELGSLPQGLKQLNASSNRPPGVDTAVRL